jgi:hypothetical protein
MEIRDMEEGEKGEVWDIDVRAQIQDRRDREIREALEAEIRNALGTGHTHQADGQDAGHRQGRGDRQAGKGQTETEDEEGQGGTE